MINAVIPVITIDGPSGSGKGTISLLLARHLGWHMLDSGALYRAFALAAIRQNIGLHDEQGLEKLGNQLDVEFDISSIEKELIVSLAKEDVSQLIRTEKIGSAASQIAKLRKVRQSLMAKQKSFRKSPGLVADGRDMGTVVFSDAVIKIYLTASHEERAKRRHKQLLEKGLTVDLDQLIDEIAERDARDQSREHSPLKPAENACIVDTTELSVNDVLKSVLACLS